MATYTNPVFLAATTEDHFEKSMKVRITVFVDEQKYPLYTEVDDEYNDKSYVWLVQCDKTLENGQVEHDVPVGTVRLITVSETVGKLGRLAVISEARGLSLGKKLVQTVVKDAADRGMTAIVIHAQYDKQGFYERLGFAVEKGDEQTFLEDGTPHIRMWHRGVGKN
ncbi:acyl-CoA N-acyltransferase [Halteromyces radiatus]|uniref:acyl-CoA N-acyltransferase n=1 Tax=Halteromyces radiatus TaxID=101107 RepID=UPI00221FC51C|nr:acyl-CoA N-acyltransferase [Halteromyces radiatus]KAI8084784.1 acyl-CoA N-acyltransferase [Halteromyces radiatus]